MTEYERINSEELCSLRSEKSSAVKSETIPPYLVGVKTFSRLEWDSLVAVFSLFNCFFIVFFLSFECENMMVIAMKTCGIFTDIVFCLDLYFNFMTSYIESQTGDEVIKLPKIAWRYLKNWLILDLISAVPIFFISYPCNIMDVVVTLVRLSKLQRILAVIQRLMYFRLHKNIRILIKFFEIILWLMIYIHLMSCLWNYVIHTHHLWQPFATIVTDRDFYGLELSMRYSLCVYTMVFSISRIEMVPHTEFEHAFLGATIILGMLIVGVLFGKIIVLLQDIGKESLKFAIEKEKISNTIQNLHLPRELQTNIIEFFTSSFTILDQEISYQKIISFLPPSITKKLNICLFKQLFSSSKLFAQDLKVVSYLINKLENKFCQPEEEIIKQFESGDKIYFVSEGTCEVEVLDEMKEKHRVKLLLQGSYFGEIAVLFETTRTATVKSIDFASLAVLGKDKLGSLFNKFPTIKKSLMAGIIKYKDPYQMFIEKSLNKLTYFQGLPGNSLNKIIYSLPVYSCPVGTDVFSAGDQCNSSFIILDGKVQIFFEVHGPSMMHKLRKQTMHAKRSKKIKAIHLVIEELGKGSVICQNLVLMQQKLVVSCRCSQQARIMAISKENLDQIIQKFPDVKYLAEEIIAKNTVFDESSGEAKLATIPLDYYKAQKYDGNRKCSMKSRIKFKNAVINRILIFRENKKLRLPKITLLMERLNAIHKAEEQHRYDIAHKITIGELPPESINVMEFLKKKYHTNPLISQFAIKSKETLKLTESFKGHLDEMHMKLNELKNDSMAMYMSSDSLIGKFSTVEKIISK